ncbi:MAG: hypothetical protein HKN20_12390, partial [Gemmatimonadetes bacterium]|nr:hypothetical protein [Gemmatimonadota bacterium]
MVERLRHTIQTNKRAVAIGSVLVVGLLALLAFQGRALFQAAGGAGSSVVDKVVGSVAYKDKAPAPAPSTEPNQQAAVAGSGKNAVAGSGKNAVASAGQAEEEMPRGYLDPRAAEDAREEARLAAEARSGMTEPSPAEGRAGVTVVAEQKATEDIPEVTLQQPDEEADNMRPHFEPYRSYGLRDPMVPLVIAGKTDASDSRFSIYNLALVGIAWKSGDRVALLEDKKGKSYLYRKGDLISDGARVVEIGRDTITFAVVKYGETTRFTLKVVTKE